MFLFFARTQYTLVVLFCDLSPAYSLAHGLQNPTLALERTHPLDELLPAPRRLLRNIPPPTEPPLFNLPPHPNPQARQESPPYRVSSPYSSPTSAANTRSPPLPPPPPPPPGRGGGGGTATILERAAAAPCPARQARQPGSLRREVRSSGSLVGACRGHAYAVGGARGLSKYECKKSGVGVEACFGCHVIEPRVGTRPFTGISRRLKTYVHHSARRQERLHGTRLHGAMYNTRTKCGGIPNAVEYPCPDYSMLHLACSFASEVLVAPRKRHHKPSGTYLS